ncbi:MAG: hypothetical protein ABJB76_12885 [Candidatus Nitrosocosmicus sp.]
MDYVFRTTILSIAVIVLVIYIIIIPASQVGITLSSSKKNNSYNINYVLAKKSGESNNNNSCISCFTALLTPKQISMLEHGLGVKSIQELCKQIETGDIGRADFYTAILYLTDVPPSTDVQISKCLRNNGIEFAQ